MGTCKLLIPSHSNCSWCWGFGTYFKEIWLWYDHTYVSFSLLCKTEAILRLFGYFVVLFFTGGYLRLVFSEEKPLLLDLKTWGNLCFSLICLYMCVWGYLLWILKKQAYFPFSGSCFVSKFMIIYIDRIFSIQVIFISTVAPELCLWTITTVIVRLWVGVCGDLFSSTAFLKFEWVYVDWLKKKQKMEIVITELNFCTYTD